MLGWTQSKISVRKHMNLYINVLVHAGPAYVCLVLGWSVGAAVEALTWCKVFLRTGAAGECGLIRVRPQTFGELNKGAVVCKSTVK